VRYCSILISFYSSLSSEIFNHENLAQRPLSRYTLRALQNRHLEVLTTLLMLKIEAEQEEYRKLMRLAEELCIEDFSSSDSKLKESASNWLNQIDQDLLLKLKALCHVN
jgi:hypothetical protein